MDETDTVLTSWNPQAGRGTSSQQGAQGHLRAPSSFFFNIYLFLREREREREREHEQGRAERERETQNLKQDPGSEPSAESPKWGSNSQTMRS